MDSSIISKTNFLKWNPAKPVVPTDSSLIMRPNAPKSRKLHGSPRTRKYHSRGQEPKANLVEFLDNKSVKYARSSHRYLKFHVVAKFKNIICLVVV